MFAKCCVLKFTCQNNWWDWVKNVKYFSTLLSARRTVVTPRATAPASSATWTRTQTWRSARRPWSWWTCPRARGTSGWTTTTTCSPCRRPPPPRSAPRRSRRGPRLPPPAPTCPSTRTRSRSRGRSAPPSSSSAPGGAASRGTPARRWVLFWNTTKRGKVDIYNLQLSRGSSVTSVNTWDFRSLGLTQSVTTRKNSTTQRLNRSAFVVVAT